MTDEQQALLAVLGALQRLDIPHMVTGSLASSFHGRPRSTHDAHIVIDPSAGQLDQLVSALSAAGFYVDPERARDALLRRLQFDAIETSTAFKVDLILRKERPFSLEELARRRSVELLPGAPVSIASPEDTILSKLEWSRNAGGSEKQLGDAAGILAVSPELDRAYVERWAGELGVLDLWRRAVEESGKAR